jgi:hypothetical protein
MGMPVDVQRVLAQQKRRRRLVEIARRRPRAEEALAEPNRPFVGVDVKPDEVGELVELYGFERCDLQGS